MVAPSARTRRRAGPLAPERADHARIRAQLAQNQTRAALKAAKQLAQRDGADAADWALLGTCVLDAGPAADAIAIYKAALARFGDDPELLRGLGRASLASGSPRAAALAFGSAIQTDPEDPHQYLHLARAFGQIEKFKDTAQCAEIYVKLRSECPAALAEAGLEALRCGDAQRAAYWYEQSLAAHPQNAQAWNNLGLAYRALGDGARAEIALQEAVRQQPGSAEYLHNLSTVGAPPAGFESAAKHLRKRAKMPRHKALAGFAEAKWYDDGKDHGRAYGAFVRANEAARIWAGPAALPCVPRNIDWSDARGENAAGGPVPIFIVGLPRSGTTLLERLISQSEGVTALGERDWLARAISQQEGASAQAVMQAYLSHLPDHAAQTAAFTDKMPHNWQHLGHILNGHSGARVVHIHRDLRAVGWSIYRHFFVNGGALMRFSFSQDDILRMAEIYTKTLRVWDSCFPQQIMHISYEDFVANADQRTAALRAHLGLPGGLPGAAAALNAGQGIRTASALQARKPVYAGSNDAWRAYAQFAPDWFDALGSLDRAFRADLPRAL